MSDTLSHRVFIMSAHTGEIITSFGGMKGHHDLMFEGPCGIAIDGAGNINVVDSGNNRIQVNILTIYQESMNVAQTLI